MTDGHNSGALHTAPLRGLLHHGAANALHLNKRQHPLRNNFLARSIFSNVFDKRTFKEKSPKLLKNATPSNFLRFNSRYSATIVNRNDKYSSWWDRDWRNWVWVSFLRQIEKKLLYFLLLIVLRSIIFFKGRFGIRRSYRSTNRFDFGWNDRSGPRRWRKQYAKGLFFW